MSSIYSLFYSLKTKNHHTDCWRTATSLVEETGLLSAGAGEVVGTLQTGRVVDEHRDVVAECPVVVGDAESPRVARLCAARVTRRHRQLTQHFAVRSNSSTDREVRPLRLSRTASVLHSLHTHATHPPIHVYKNNYNVPIKQYIITSYSWTGLDRKTKNWIQKRCLLAAELVNAPWGIHTRHAVQRGAADARS